MQKRILKTNLISCIVASIMAVFVCVFAFTGSLQNTMNEQAYSQTMLLVHILENADWEPRRVLEDIKSDIYGRITLVNNQGDVVFDSDYAAAEMESHSDRMEIINAFQKGVGVSQRYSQTSKRMTYYCAAKVEDIGVIRVGVMSSTMAGSVIISTSPVIWLSVSVITLLIFFFSSVTARRIVENIEQYDIETGEGDIYDELSHFVNKIKKQNDIISQQLQSLTEEKLKLQSIFLNIKEGIIVCDSRYNIIQTNSEAEQIFSLSGSGNNFYKSVRVPQLQQAVSRCIGGHVTHGMFEMNDMWYQFIASPNHYAGDVGVILIVLDITRQVENEKNRRLFTDNVTHELKTPLTSILGYSQLITNGLAKAEDVTKFVGIIESNAKNLLAMIDDIIKISNLESGYGFNKVPLDMDKIVQSAADRQTMTAQSCQVKIICNVRPVRLMADENQMYQLVQNLISNAIKYNVAGGKVDISLKQENDFAVLQVSDTGIGIAARDTEKIFERFYVVDKSRNKNISSTGLGLSIVKHVVKAHDGFISVKSALGKGTTFTIKLPIGLNK